MVKKITLVLFITIHLLGFSQAISDDQYNAFSSRGFMKFNNFMSVPTFSLLHRNGSTIEAISRSSNIEFEDASRLHLVSYSGKMRSNVGAGIAVFQQEIGVFKDFGAIGNYAYQLKLNDKTKLTFGFNFLYSRRSIDQPRILSNGVDPLINNYQDKPVVVFQPAATVSFGNFDVGIFFENLGDFNLKTSEMVTDFADKTISAHAAYSFKLNSMKGFFEDTTVRAIGVARRGPESELQESFSYGATVLADLPKAGWIKVGYDNRFGINAGFGINLNKRLSIGFSYEKPENLSGTNEVGLIYSLGRRRGRRVDSRTSEVKVILPDNAPPPPAIDTRKNVYEDPEHEGLSDEIRTAQDSIIKLNKRVNDILKLLENTPPKKVTDVPSTEENNEEQVLPEEERDQTLPRRRARPWRTSTITRTGGGGTMYYVAFDQFRDIQKAKDKVNEYKRRKVKARYVKDPKYNSYVVYFKRFAKKEDAEEIVEEVNKKGDARFEKENTSEDSDLGSLKAAKGGGKGDPIYVMKITLGAKGETYKEPKTQPRARVTTVKKTGNLEEGYYMQVGVFSKKSYADRFLDELENDGINAGYYINPKTGNRHIYIHKTSDRAEIIKLYNNNLNGSYYDRKSIIHIR
ncbi:PorP/SprF family type IX secretion system membrane protein [Tenacibaculum sp. M341]|uniref:PorP/SprF family type IX secretion system membrane protein n=1 Tax=Tenacibaculum sp. M341 TaxID=2530339 RepID=UPI001045AE9D|nr:PorP/SprF family type IX secretion system membrane protein [Tenacibaculum sp. M341]TCI85246.1 type IX secretion system membrane protein PorP/SprF [Tenacibaculum sp. M341]